MLTNEEREQRIERSSKLVAKAVFNSILVTLVSFAPILLLTGQEKKMFTPLVLTKSFAMMGSALVAIFLVPVLMSYLLKGKVIPEKKHPVSRFFIRLYDPVIRLGLRWRKATLLIAQLHLHW
jgi:copper/silver efflux system protein